MNKVSTLIQQGGPQRRPDNCAAHGAFESICYFAGAWTRCPACTAEAQRREEAAEAQRKLDLRIAAWERRLGHAGIPERFRDRTLDTYLAATPGQRAALEFARHYADDFDAVLATGRSALFVGKFGTGKTHIAVGIALQIMRARRTALFITTVRALRRVKDTWSRDSKETESQAIASLVFPDLLILDEVGVQFGSEAEKIILFDVLNERYEKRKPTLLLSNLPTTDVRAFLGERIYDRLREDGGQFVAFDWESHRGKP